MSLEDYWMYSSYLKQTELIKQCYLKTVVINSILKASTGALTYFLMQLLMHGLDSYNYAVSELTTGAVAYGAQGSYYPSSLVPHPSAPVSEASYSKHATYTLSQNKGWKRSSRSWQNGWILRGTMCYRVIYLLVLLNCKLCEPRKIIYFRKAQEHMRQI